jgi:hypothetical protein
MSPTSGALFNPILESDENEEDENRAVEFRGFFVNSAPLSSPIVPPELNLARPASIDQVTVLDVSTSMEVPKLLVAEAEFGGREEGFGGRSTRNGFGRGKNGRTEEGIFFCCLQLLLTWQFLHL